ncbi:hypothetical protein PENTCL1PPCAC_23563 [Pristionchus entomophagus]|uniref:Uncharacterized protein n=1 Tax=Pristionchus entomophagus TaxID=358040 RepID=A0AAV5U5K6_9BILA|nr:hypothetical protein PENTCL1PPCAC_23563 [Pristionchus entomophagus]
MENSTPQSIECWLTECISIRDQRKSQVQNCQFVGSHWKNALLTGIYTGILQSIPSSGYVITSTCRFHLIPHILFLEFFPTMCST